jgi:protein-disulfide isomerase
VLSPFLIGIDMVKNRDSLSAAFDVCKIAAAFILLAIILVTVSGCATSKTNLDNRPVQVNPDKNSSKTVQSSLKIIIYTDFECGACERFNLRIEPKLREYETAGTAQIEIRPLGVLSDDSSRAAQAALWAGDYGNFLEYHNALFDRYRQDNNDPYAKDKLLELAGSLDLNEKALRRCLDTGSKVPELAKNKSMAKADGVDTLPAVFINGVKIEGLKPLETYIQIIDRTLSDYKKE